MQRQNNGQVSKKSHEVNQLLKSNYAKPNNWTQKEVLRYAIFLQIFQRNYLTTKKRPNLLKLMSALIETRTISQCRSYFNQMQKENSSIKDIINQSKAKVGPDDYQIEFKRCKDYLVNFLAQNRQQYKKIVSQDEQLSLLVNERNNFTKNQLKKATKKTSSILISNQVKIQPEQLKEQNHKANAFVMNYPFNRSFMNLDPSISSEKISKQKQAKEINEPIESSIFNRVPVQQNFSNFLRMQQLQCRNPYSQPIPQQKAQVRKRIQEMLIKNPYIVSLTKQQIVQRCNFHWNSWLKFSLQLAEAQSKQKTMKKVKQ